MKIPFIKAHGAGNDFLFTFTHELPAGFSLEDAPSLARAICHRNTGVGADGWYLIDDGPGRLPSVKLWNSDGSKAELSGNGTRCACGILVEQGLVAGNEVRIGTGSGEKIAVLKHRDEHGLWFEMEMGVPRVDALHLSLPLAGGNMDATVLNVGNPQCSVPVASFETIAWRALGAEIEDHVHFAPAKTNVSFVRAVGPHEIDVRFWERGAHHTLSSGTGSVGAAVTAILRGTAQSPVTVQTEFCPMTVRWESASEPVYLTGPARIIARGEFEN